MSSLVLCSLALWLAAQGGRLVLEPAEVEVGEPVTVRYTLRHQPSAHPTVDPKRLVPDQSWAVLSPPRLTRRIAQEGAACESRFEYVIVSLEPGERAFPAPPLVGLDADPEVAPADLRVKGVLAEGEDEPRGWLGFRPAPRGVEPVPATRLLALAALPLVALACWWILRRRRRRPAPAAPAPSARERLASAFAAAQASGEPDLTRRAYAVMTRLLRAAVAARLGRADPAGLADEEWLATVRGEGALPGATLEALGALVEEAARVKYAGHLPTPFALAEVRARAEACLADLAGAERAAQAPREAAA